mmetsp:Transcript_10518/g.23489  ORF Transcript_10518/g.23489 Transcript_10518/m.23489 type:complete len:630 (-) Transcript_10518:15-1904(-)
MSEDLIPGSNAAVVEIVGRIICLTREQLGGALATGDIDTIRRCAGQAMEDLARSDGGSSGARASEPVVDAIPCLCSLAMACIEVVEKVELNTGLARLVSAGYEILAALLLQRYEPAGEAVESTLENLCDCIDFLALEIYCTLCRPEAVATACHYNSADDEFGLGDYWGCLEHRQAMQELSVWLLCTVFRAVGPAAVNAPLLMEFTNSDPLCLCSLLRGFFSMRPDASNAPHDSFLLQSMALSALCGLTAPELAFPFYSGDDGSADIHEQNKVLLLYLEVLCSAVVETGLFLPAIEAALAQAYAASQVPGWEARGRTSVRFLSFLSALVLQAEQEVPDEDDPWPPGRRLQSEMQRRVDELGKLLETILGAGPGGSRPEYLRAGSVLKDLLLAAAGICAALAGDASRHTEDAFTSVCRMLLAECLVEGSMCFAATAESERAGLLVGLTVLAANVGDLCLYAERLSAMAACIAEEERHRSRARLLSTGYGRLPLRAGSAEVLAIFSCPADQFPASTSYGSAPAKVGTAEVNSATKPGTLRDLVQQAPQEFRCRLDGKLLCDPVVSPSGAVFERTNLLRWFQEHGQICPHSGLPLRIEDCERSAEIRRGVTAWVRSSQCGQSSGRKGRRRKKG